MSDNFDKAAAGRREFVDGAGKEAPKKQEMPRVVAAGRISGRKENYAPGNTYYLHKSVAKWLDDNTIGNRQLVLNYLLSVAIKELEKSDERVMFDDFEGL